MTPRLLCPELALDHDQRSAFASHLDGVCVAQLELREAAPPSRRAQQRADSW